jgi:hypothetical protein
MPILSAKGQKGQGLKGRKGKMGELLAVSYIQSATWFSEFIQKNGEN